MVATHALALCLGMSSFSLQHRAIVPDHRLAEPWWKERHERCVALTQAGQCNVLFVGDSITQGWESTGKATWDRVFVPLGAANFGFSGDRTENVLWRIENGEMAGLQPKVVVILIGTNNIGHQSSTPAQTADGVKAIVAAFRKSMPKAKILLQAILPRGKDAQDPMRIQVAEATEGYRGIADGRSIFFVDPGKHFVNADGSLRSSLLPDLLHLTTEAYAIWAKALEPEIRRLMEMTDAP